MKTLKHTLILTFITFSVISCSSNIQKYEPATERGKINKKILCKQDSTTSYALYLPSKYDSAVKYPIIIAFDSHGDGLKPVTLFKEQAEKFGYIVVGSNNSKNGQSWDNSNAIYNTMLTDIKNRFSINDSRIYTAGFSGGSRVASSIAILNGGIAGVIGFSAGFPNLNQPITHKFDYLGIVGSSDFNFNEMNQLDKALQSNGFNHYLIVFNGKHEWPKAEVIPDMFYWMEFCAYRNKLSTPDKQVIADFEANCQKEIELCKSKKNVLGEYKMQLKLICFLDGISDIEKYRSNVVELEKTPVLQNELRQIEAEAQKEQSLQEFYVKAMNGKDLAWWKTEVARINTIIAKNGDKRESFLYKRVLSYLSICGYSYSNNSLRSGQLDQAQNFISIYTLVDPENPDPAYFQAQLFGMKNDTQNALKYLEKAIDLGFNDINKMQSEPAFSTMKSTAEFIRLEKKINLK